MFTAFSSLGQWLCEWQSNSFKESSPRQISEHSRYQNKCYEVSSKLLSQGTGESENLQLTHFLLESESLQKLRTVDGGLCWWWWWNGGGSDDDGDNDDDRSEWSQSYMLKRHYLIVMFRLMIMAVTKLQPNLSTAVILGTEESGHCVEVTIMGR